MIINSPLRKKKYAKYSNTKHNLSTSDFTFHKLLGKGSFGEVYLSSLKSKRKEIFAIKVLSKEKIVKKNLTRYALTEKKILSLVKNPFIVKLYAAF